MVTNYYDLQTHDFKIIQGDTVNLPFDFLNPSNEALNITSYGIKFSLADPVTGAILISKEHDDVPVGGEGIYFNGDSEIPSGLTIDAVNKLIVVLTSVDTAALNEGSYPFDLEFTSGSNKFTPVTGFVQVKKQVTA